MSSQGEEEESLPPLSRVASHDQFFDFSTVNDSSSLVHTHYADSSLRDPATLFLEPRPAARYHGHDVHSSRDATLSGCSSPNHSAVAASGSIPPCVAIAFFQVEKCLRDKLSSTMFPAAFIRSVAFLVFFLCVTGVAFVSALLISLVNDASLSKDASFASVRFVSNRIDPIPAPFNKDAAKEKDDDRRYAVAIDCGSSGSRLFVYVWPPQSQQADLLQIIELKGSDGKSVKKKIEPGISSLAENLNPSNATEYIRPLLEFAAKNIPRAKHKATPLFILATAGMRMLPKTQQEAILNDLRLNVKNHFNFVYSDHNFQVISGKDEGVFQWIAANYMLGKFKHITDGDDPLIVVQNQSTDFVRKRTVGIIDMGGGSLQIAFEITKERQWKAIQGEKSASDFIAEFNLGCQRSDVKHHYRLYVTTFLGYGGNAIIKKYYTKLADANRLQQTDTINVLSSSSSSYSSPPTLGSSSHPISDPCLSKDEDHVVRVPLSTDDNDKDITDGVKKSFRSVHFRGNGNFLACVDRLVPLLQPSSSSSSSKCPFNTENAICSVNGTFQPKVSSYNSEFYGFSEFFYSSYDILGIKGRYESKLFAEKAQGYCATPWNVSLERHGQRLYPMADMFRLRSQCIKSAYVYAALHRGFKFPITYSALNNEQLINGQEIQWTLGALLYRMRFYPLGDQQQARQHGGGGGGGVASGIKTHSHHDQEFFFDRDVPFSQYLLLALIVLFIGVIVVLAKRLRRWLRFSSTSFSSTFSVSSSSSGRSSIGIFKLPESLDASPGGERLRKSSESCDPLLV